ncbi:YycC family protein [Paenibacillus sp.]|uniref:YycC family protein n=1 Tax=Paenibacillus sp. TaxID=58172 RepID=UPI002D634CCD|nr:YycC family protein [Paenibacillus sp.]HZG57603.1 YycC family protein [Paenibacillus sp.]
MRPLQISPETAVKLAAKLNVPLEQLMHMPQHILLAKLAELAKSEAPPQAPEEKEKRTEE